MDAGLVTSFLVYWEAFCFSKWKKVAYLRVLSKKKGALSGQKLADTKNLFVCWELEICTVKHGFWPCNKLSGLFISFLLCQMAKGGVCKGAELKKSFPVESKACWYQKTFAYIGNGKTWLLAFWQAFWFIGKLSAFTNEKQKHLSKVLS